MSGEDRSGEARAARLAEALRANLHRRKAQARARRGAVRDAGQAGEDAPPGRGGACEDDG